MFKVNYFLNNDESGKIYTTYVEEIDSIATLEEILNGEVFYIEKEPTSPPAK